MPQISQHPLPYLRAGTCRPGDRQSGCGDWIALSRARLAPCPSARPAWPAWRPPSCPRQWLPLDFSLGKRHFPHVTQAHQAHPSRGMEGRSLHSRRPQRSFESAGVGLRGLGFPYARDSQARRARTTANPGIPELTSGLAHSHRSGSCLGQASCSALAAECRFPGSYSWPPLQRKGKGLLSTGSNTL